MTDVSGVWNCKILIIFISLSIIFNNIYFNIGPAVHINNITYHGRYQAKAVEEAICAGMIPTSRSLRCK